MIDAIIFDMDGTLVDFVKEIQEAWNLSCKNYGWNKEFTYEQIKNVMGLNGHDIGVALFPEIDEITAEERIKICSAEEIGYLKMHMGKTFIESEDILVKLSSEYKLFIVSNCLTGYIENFLDYFHYNKYFIDSVNASNGRSKGQNIKYLVDKYNLKEPIYVGDTIKDMESSKEANVRFVHASYGYGKVDCKDKINSLAELLNIK